MCVLAKTHRQMAKSYISGTRTEWFMCAAAKQFVHFDSSYSLRPPSHRASNSSMRLQKRQSCRPFRFACVGWVHASERASSCVCACVCAATKWNHVLFLLRVSSGQILWCIKWNHSELIHNATETAHTHKQSERSQCRDCFVYENENNI